MYLYTPFPFLPAPRTFSFTTTVHFKRENGNTPERWAASLPIDVITALSLDSRDVNDGIKAAIAQHHNIPHEFSNEFRIFSEGRLRFKKIVILRNQSLFVRATEIDFIGTSRRSYALQLQQQLLSSMGPDDYVKITYELVDDKKHRRAKTDYRLEGGKGGKKLSVSRRKRTSSKRKDYK